MSIDARVPTAGNAGKDADMVDWNLSVGSLVTAGIKAADLMPTLRQRHGTLTLGQPHPRPGTRAGEGESAHHPYRCWGDQGYARQGGQPLVPD